MSNSVVRAYPKHHKSKTLCPCPPETSVDSTANANANVSAEVDGGILYYKVDCNDCGGKSFHHENYGFIICYGCLSPDPIPDGRARCECGELWIIGEYVCRHCGFQSEIPF